MIFRFAGLPNNAQLEMVACTKVRAVSNVTICLQPEDGDRVTCEFSPSTTLAQALTKIYPDSDLKRAVLIYMHREVYGKEALENTTLKSLGLNSGKAILRLIYRDPEQLQTQAHVSTLLLPKSATTTNDSLSTKDYHRVPSSVPHCSKTIDDVDTSARSLSVKVENQEELKREIKINTKKEKIDALNNEKKEDTSRIENYSIASSHKDHIEKDQHITETCVKVQENAYEIKFLGERNALIFNQAGTQAVPRDELPDSFFDLDLHDAKMLLRDAKRRREQLEDAPLVTEAQRQLDRDKRTLNRLNKYRRAVIRIQFPDQFVLQGLFEPLETIESVKNFIKNYLDDPECEFTLYTTPPKHILNPDVRLIDEDLVPSAIVHYSGQSPLKSSVKEKLTDPRVAGIEAVKSRTTTTQKEQDLAIENDRGTLIESNHVIPGPSGISKSSSSSLSSSSSSSSSSSAQNQNRTPKWFKQTFK
ncbi:hypothetical protein P5V15_000558 [Pogonomyrmex californicus]